MVLALSAALVRNGNRRLLESLRELGVRGIDPGHGDLLGELLRAGGEGVGIGELAKSTDRTKSTVSTLVSGLVRHGYVCKEPGGGDRRAVRVRLTEKGKALLPVFERISRRMDEELEAMFDGPELDRLESMLSAISGRWRR